MRKPQVLIQPETYDFIKTQAKKNRRTIQGQTEIMLEIAKREMEEADRVRCGEAQLTTPDFLDGPLNSGDGTYKP